MSPNNNCAGMDVRRSLELLAVLTILLSVVGLLSARLGVFHAPQVWLVALLGTFAYHKLVVSRSLSSAPMSPSWHVVLVLGVALVFRLTPYVYVMGGQDEGVYVNMAMHIAHTGGLDPVDKVLAGISDPGVAQQYRSGNYLPTIYLPGVYSTEQGLQFQFYHLFPIWLALFADIFGVEGAGYGLTLLSLVSILYFQRIAHLISGRASVGLAAGLLLAVNPLHAFFSKFPVSEVPALAFSAMSFAFLLEYWRADGERLPTRLLIISATALGLMFLTRISGFMYLPTVLAIGVVAISFDIGLEKRRALLAWVAGTVLLYAFSVFDGLKWSRMYSRDIYQAAFSNAFGSHWHVVIVTVAVAAALAFGAVWVLSRAEKARGALRMFTLSVATVLPAVIVALLAVAAYKAYRLGYTDAYSADPWVGKRFRLSHRGVASIFSTSIPVAGIYLSPFIFTGGLVATFLVPRNAPLQLLLLFVTCFLGYIAVMQWSVPYQPYYARYLLSEFVPYMLLLAICVWASLDQGKLKAAMGTALVLGGLYCAALSALQIGKNEGEGVVSSVAHLIKRVDAGDLVVIDQRLGSPPVYDLKTALLYTYELNVVTMTLPDTAGGKYRDTLFDSYDEVYLLTRTEKVPDGFQFIDSFRFEERAFKAGAVPPTTTYLRNRSRVLVYRYDAQSLDATRISFASGHATRLLGDGWSSPEPWGVWTNGRVANLRLGALGARRMLKPVLRIVGRAHVTPLAPVQRIRISSGGSSAEAEIRFPEQQVQIDLPLSASNLTSDYLEVTVDTPDAVSPSALSSSSDTRLLAFGLHSAEFSDAAGVSRPAH